MYETSGYFNYGAYGLDYNNNIIARRVIKYHKVEGMKYILDEVFNYRDDQPIDSEEFYRKIYGPEKYQEVDYGIRLNGEYRSVASIEWNEWRLESSTLTCPGESPVATNFQSLVDVREDHCDSQW